MKVFLDDERRTPNGWWRVYEPCQAIAILQSGLCSHISLDHDLGSDDDIGTGNDVLVWIEEQVVTNGFVPPKILVHTANPSARIKMEAGVKQIRKLHERNKTKT